MIKDKDSQIELLEQFLKMRDVSMKEITVGYLKDLTMLREVNFRNN